MSKEIGSDSETEETKAAVEQALSDRRLEMAVTDCKVGGVDAAGAPAKKQVAAPEPAEEPKKPDLTVVASEEAPEPEAPPPPPPPTGSADPAAEARFAEIKINIFNSLIDTVDLTELGKLESAQVREEITDIVTEIISLRNRNRSGPGG